MPPLAPIAPTNSPPLTIGKPPSDATAWFSSRNVNTAAVFFDYKVAEQLARTAEQSGGARLALGDIDRRVVRALHRRLGDELSDGTNDGNGHFPVVLARLRHAGRDRLLCLGEGDWRAIGNVERHLLGHAGGGLGVRGGEACRQQRGRTCGGS